VILYIRK